jgi:TonB-linked SusC/RagA family outer membrane protein
MYKRQNTYGEGFDNRIVLSENLSWGPKVDGVVRPWTNIVLDKNGNETQLFKPYSAIKNQMQNFFDLGITNTNNIAIEGGTDRFNYRVSYGNTNNKATVPYNYYKRHNITIAGEAKLSDKLETNFTVTYNKSLIRTNTSGSNNTNQPLAILTNTPIDIPVSELRDYNNPYYGPEGYYTPYTVNPYFLLAKSYNTNNVDNFLGQVTIDYKPVKGLDLVSRVGTNFTNSFIEMKSPKYHFADNFINEDGSPGKSNVGRYYESSERYNDLNIDIYANYKNDFGKKKHFNFNIIGGFNYVDRRTSILTGSTNSGLIFEDKYDLSNSNAQPFVSDVKQQRRLSGIYANVSLGYHNLLFLDYSARNDWSSTLPVGRRGFFYQSGGISFVPTELLKTPNKWVSYLKLRANAGSVGKDARFGNINTTVQMNPAFDDFGNPTYQYLYPMQVRDTTFTGLTVSNAAGNDKIKPEITTTFEGGLDVTMLYDRLTIGITGYYQLSKNQIVTAPSSPSSGFSTVLQNIGKVSNKGIELNLNATLLKDLKGLNWSVYFNYAMNKSKVIKVSTERNEVQLGTGSTAISLVAKEGQPFGIFKAETYLRDSLGRIMLNFANGLPLQSQSQGYFGTFQPKYTMGFGSTLSWKGLSVNVAFDLKKGGVFWSNSKSNGEFSGTTTSTLLNNRVPFIHPNTSYKDPISGLIVANTSLATPTDVTYFSALQESDHLIDASYIKLREISLGYSVPSKCFKGSPISAISIGVYGRNLKTWVPKSNAYADPELGSFDGANSNAQGFETSTAPFSRSYGFDFKIGF